MNIKNITIQREMNAPSKAKVTRYGDLIVPLRKLHRCMPPQSPAVQVLTFFLFFLQLGIGIKAAPSVASEIRDLTHAPTRIVWCQDTSDDSDAGAMGTNLHLMGFDTEDGCGERAILSKLSNYARPLITPSGKRVIFSNRQENNIYIVNWDGSGLQRLGNGFAVGVWQDPSNGVEWIYAGSWLTNTDALFPIQRAPIDQPDRVETVWNRTLVHPDNFQLSADGRRACGNLPWPICGIAELPEGDWKKYGDGCWPALAPENAGLFWIFDGAHRNLTLFRTDTDKRWTINISHAPGIESFEVYHPRWSNRARFMVMTGPYKQGSGDNRIRGGGPEVEVHLGRFDERFGSIERWVRVTRNNRADFFPDVWIALPTGASATAAAPAAISIPAPAARWPGNADGLVFLWENRSGKNEISLPDSKTTRTCRAEPRGKARYGRYFEMDLAGGWFSTETEIGAQLLTACLNSNRFSLEAVLTPQQSELTDYLQIASFAALQTVNFTLGQKRDQLILRLNTSDTAGLGPAIPLCRLAPAKPQHVLISYMPGQLICFLDGKPTLLTNSPLGNLAGWMPGELVFGNRTRPWSGRLDHIAIYNHVKNESDARQSYASLAEDMQRRTAARRLTVEARLAEVTKTPPLASISPYRRALAVDRYDEVKPIKGQYPHKQILVARWVILDRQRLDTPARQQDSIHRLVLEPFDEHPELEGERMIMDNEDFSLPLYYAVD